LSLSLADRLRTETRALHTAAERSTFMGALLRGRMPVSHYVLLLRNLHAIYEVLEPALSRHARHPAIAPVYLPALRRSGALAHDLGLLHGAGWADALPLQSATRRYRERLRELDIDHPERLLSHAYVRYLGDLSGGQILRGIVATMLPAEKVAATAFYEFGDAAQTRALQQAFRAGLAAIAVDEGQRDALVREAQLAFELHHRLFDELVAAESHRA
jgi:heme oxygenase (biliverdin-producing, ferredoxin)